MSHDTHKTLTAHRGYRLQSHITVMCINTVLMMIPGRGWAQENPANDNLLSEILSVYRARAEQRNPIWVRYTLSHFESAELLALMRTKNPSDLHWTTTEEFAQKGVKTRWWSDRKHPRADSPSAEDFLIFNGEVSVSPSNLERNFLLTRTPTMAFTTPTVISFEDRLRGTLEKWNSSKDKITRSVVRWPFGDSERLVEIELVYPTKWRSEYKLLADREYVTKSFMDYNDRNELAFKSEVTAYETYGGIVYPKVGFREHYERGKLASKISFEVHSVETRASYIPDSLFTFHFPADALMWDDDNKVMVRNTEVTESHLNEVVGRLSPRRNLWRAWLNVGVFVSSGVLLTLVAGQLRRRWRRAGAHN